MDTFRIQPISEAAVDEIIIAAGGMRAHPDADRRQKPGADYLLGDALIELKVLDEDGLSKPERQQKLAELFRRFGDKRPVVVLDRDRLPDSGQREFDRILDRPINGIVKKARDQLLQSRREYGQATCSILMVLNNGYTALDHDALVALVARRARQDTHEIDGVIVGGCYYYGDGFDSAFLWPLDYVPINVTASFHGFPELRRMWHGYAAKTMTAMIRGELPVDRGKGSVVDTQFDVNDATFVKPAPPMGRKSEFYVRGRPRKITRSDNTVPPVALTFPDMTVNEWQRFREVLPSDPLLCDSYAAWRKHRAGGVEAGSVLQPFVATPVTRDGWLVWCDEHRQPKSLGSIRRYANELFSEQLMLLLTNAVEQKPDSATPSRYVLVITEEIGQDRSNDLTKIGLVQASGPEDLVVKELVRDARIFHEHGLALAGAYALAEGVDCLMWQKDMHYTWT